MLKTPLTVHADGHLCKIRDASGRMLGSGFTPIEAHEVARRCNESNVELIKALHLGLHAMNTLDYQPTPDNRAFVVAARAALIAAGETPRG